MVTLGFIDFWPGFNPEVNFFKGLIDDITGENSRIANKYQEKVDLEISSVFTFPSKSKRIENYLKRSLGRELSESDLSLSNNQYRSQPFFNSKARVWYTGENIHPPSESFDLTLSFSKTDPILKNCYFPYWMYRIDWGFNSSEFEIQPEPWQLVQRRNPLVRNLNCCIFSSTQSNQRNWGLSIIETIMKVEKYGSAYSNRVASKKVTSEKYGFQFCPENTLSIGYVTEKLQEAWISRNIPIWQGIHRDDVFNKKSYIDISDLNIEEIVEKFSQISMDDKMAMSAEPLLNSMPDIDSIRNMFKKLLDNINL